MNIIQNLIIINSILFFAKVVKDSFYFLWLFQIKEYRLDRIKSHLRENIKLHFSDLIIALGTLILLSVFFPVTAKFIFVCFFLFLGCLTPVYFLYTFIEAIKDIKKHSFKRPKPTFKIVLVSAVYSIFYIVTTLLATTKIISTIELIYTVDFFILFSLYLLCLSALVPVFILLAIVIITPSSDFQKKKILKKARLKMQEMKHIKTIGITGSFGKTSTKEFLYTILSQKYKVIKTAGNNNTNMGVANTILKNVNDSFDFFICEMGAYKIGEIKETSGLVQPFAGVITGINEQHLDLFGSIQNTKKAKFELIQNLPKDGFAIINKKAAELKPKVECEVEDIVLFSEELLKDIAVDTESVEFTYKETVFKINILGKHYLENLLASIIVAEKLGMTLEEIKIAIEEMKPESEYLMQKKQGPNGAIFIDDSYSANPSGVMAALEYLDDAYPKFKKIFVFPGIIELGKNSEQIHQELWNKANEICSLVYIIQKENKEIKNRYQKCRFVFEKDFDKIKIDLRKHLDKNTVVLFESRGAGVVMKKILDKNKEK
ncbi:MAG: UDP-N-acetylmuramoyl-tripeptide--D-alanyl-D-alanine ligase [Candidatus Paceibacterota bacterium]